MQKKLFYLTGDEFTRKDIKELMFCIFYSRNKSYKKQKGIFRKVFPTITEYVESIKMTHHNKLAIKMQKIESEICIDIICQEFDKHNIKYFTIHDSWIVDEKDIQKAKDIIIESFKRKYDSYPNLNIENLKTNKKWNPIIKEVSYLFKGFKEVTIEINKKHLQDFKHFQKEIEEYGFDLALNRCSEKYVMYYLYEFRKKKKTKANKKIYRS